MMAEVTWQTIYYVLATIALMGGIISALISLRMHKDFATNDELAAVKAAIEKASQEIWREQGHLKGRQDRHHDRIVALEAVVQHMPTEKGFHDLARAMERLGGELGIAVERISSVKEGLERVEGTIARHEDILSTAARGAR